MTVFKIEPNWQPMDTAPKDGSNVVLLCVSAGFGNDVSSTWYKEYRWGAMKAYPDSESVWLAAAGDGNSYVMEQAWTKERHLSNEYGQDREINLYRGVSIVAWARPWTVEVELPEIRLPFRQEVIYDSRK